MRFSEWIYSAVGTISKYDHHPDQHLRETLTLKDRWAGSWEDYAMGMCLADVGIPYCDDEGMLYGGNDGLVLPWYYHHKTNASQMFDMSQCDVYGING